MSDDVFLSVVIPAYNETHRLPQTLKEIRPWLDAQKYPYEILIMDDASADQTVQQCREIARNWPQLVCVDGYPHGGKGACVKRGTLMAKGKNILIMDADHPTPIDTLDLMFPYMGPYDAVVGVRTFCGEEGSSGRFRRIVGLLQQLLAHIIVYKQSVADSQCGFKLFSENAVKTIFPRSLIPGGMYDVEIFLIAQIHRVRIFSKPVKWVNKEGSTINMMRCVLFDPFSLIYIRLMDWAGRYR